VVIRTLVAEAAALVREGLVALLSREEDIEVVAAIGRGSQVMTVARSLRPDVALLAAELPGRDGYMVARALQAELPGCRCAILSPVRDLRLLRKAVAVNAMGFLVNDSQADFITDAVRKLANGRKAVDPELALAALDSMRSPLTSREADALRMVAKGFTTAEIADGLCLTVGTVRNYLSRAIAKTGARNRVDAIRIADESAWL
jgi:two-component system, NarL family, response regulator DesR